MNQLEVDAIPALNVDAILDNPDENARNEELDKLMAKLEKFSMSSLLVPFQKNEGGQIDKNVIDLYRPSAAFFGGKSLKKKISPSPIICLSKFRQGRNNQNHRSR